MSINLRCGTHQIAELIKQYRNGLRYAVHYTRASRPLALCQLCMLMITDVCAAFAASFLIRIARLFPNELNLKKTAKDVEELAGILSEGETIDGAPR